MAEGEKTGSVMDRAVSAFDDTGGADIPMPGDGELEEVEASETSQSDDPFYSEEGEEEAEEVEAGPGSAEDPYTVKTLPDSHVKVRIDGEERIVPLREMVDGYMREDVFHKRMNQVKELSERAKQTAARFQQEKETFQSSFRTLMNDPDTLFSFLDEHAPEVLDNVSRKALHRAVAWQNDPQARVRHEYQKQQTRLEVERARLDQERSTYQRTREEQEAHTRYVGEFKPGYEAGMRKAGYPQVTDEFRETVKGIVAARRASTGKITAKDVEDAVVRAARALGSETVAQRRPAPAPAAAPVASRRPPQQRVGKPATAKTFSQLFRDLGK